MIYFNLLRARRENKKLVLLTQYSLPWPLHYRLTNEALFDIHSEYMVVTKRSMWLIAGNVFVTVYAAIFRLLHRIAGRVGKPLKGELYYPIVGHETLWQPASSIKRFSWKVVQDYDWPTQLHTRLPVDISPAKKEIAESVRVSMGIPVTAWFVCLHVREGGFHRDCSPERNASIANYIKAIKLITEQGGWVVRLGDPSMTPLPKMEKVIDYPFTPFKNDVMDIYLIRECRFYIGMQSGLYDVARLFQRPMVLTNMANWLDACPSKECDIGVPKHVFSKSHGRFLSVKEWMSESFDATAYIGIGKDYELHENTPEELASAVQEHMQNTHHRPTQLQQEYQRTLQCQGRMILENPILKDHERDLHHRYRIACDLVAARGVLSNAFLEKHWDYDESCPPWPTNCQGQLRE
jgi:putative glycosyltransferase (TIGR04372 family)